MKINIITIAIMLLGINIFAQNINFKFDNLNRISQVTYANGTVINYTYDELGNCTTKSIKKSNTALDNVSLKPQINIYPNPVNSDLFVELTPEVTNAEIRILDLSGKVVYNSKFTGSRTSVPVGKLPKGEYLISVKEGNESISRKFIKK
jgi:YD repeat-containing protein